MDWTASPWGALGAALTDYVGFPCVAPSPGSCAASPELGAIDAGGLGPAAAAGSLTKRPQQPPSGPLLHLACPLPSASPDGSSDAGSDRLSPASTVSVPHEARSPGRRPALSFGAGAAAAAAGRDPFCSDASEANSGEYDVVAEFPGAGGRYDGSARSSDAGSSPAATPTAAPTAAAPAPAPDSSSSDGTPGSEDSLQQAAGPHQIIGEGSIFETPAAPPAAWRLSSGAGDSRAGTPSSWGPGLSPQQQLEVLEAKLEAEAEARAALQRRLSEQRAEAERDRQALGRRYEADLAALRREMEEAADAAGGGPGGEQEALLRAYQAENELAAQRLRQQQADAQRAAAEAAAHAEELSVQLLAARAERERVAPSTPAVDAARLQELLRLQGEVDAVREAAAQREQELQWHVERLAAEGAEAPHQLEAAACELQHARRQLADSEALVQEQAQVVQALERQLLQEEGSSGTAGGGALEAENASLRQALQEAQAELDALRQTLCQAQGQLEALRQGAAGAAGGPAQQAEKAAELEAKLGRLQAALQLQQEQHGRQMRAARQAHERLRVEQGIRWAGLG